MSRWLVFSALACFALSFATPAAAVGLCGLDDSQRQRGEGDDEDLSESKDEAEQASVGHGVLMEAAAEVAPDAAPGTEVVDSIVPCAFLESGAFGAFCADVSVYVMTDNGLVLCQVPMLALEVEAETDQELERRDANTAPTYQSGLHLSGWSQARTLALVPPVALSSLPTAAPAGALLGPSDRALAVPTPPC